MKNKIAGSIKIDSAIKVLLHENSNLYLTVFFFNQQKTVENRKCIKTVLLETINLRNFYICGRSGGSF